MSYTIQFETQRKVPVNLLGKDISEGTTFVFDVNGAPSLMHKGFNGNYIWLSELGRPDHCASDSGFEVSKMYTNHSTFANYRPVQLSLLVKEL